VSFVPPGAVLEREGTMSGSGGVLGQQGVPTILRTFAVKEGVTLDAMVRSFDDKARREGLTVTVHRDGHCAVTSADDGQVIHVWRADPTQSQVRFRALYLAGNHPQTARCTAEAGPAQ
jgi:hypothetical protein